MNKTKLQGLVVNFINSEEFHDVKNEVFTRNTYQFQQPTQNALTIIDAGAHIGLSTLYFAKNYPGAHIIAIEPHPENFKLLEQNIWENNLENVETYNVALSDQEGEIELHTDTQYNWYSSASVHKGAWNGEQTDKQIKVKTKTLEYFFDLIDKSCKDALQCVSPIVLLKMDIEASEQKVLMSLGKRIQEIDQMIIEFHSHPSQKLSVLQKFLEDNGFEVKFYKKGKPIHFQQAKGLFMIEAKKH